MRALACAALALALLWVSGAVAQPSTYYYPNCLIQGTKTNAKKCQKLRNFVLRTPRCNSTVVDLGLPTNIGYGNRCIKPCGWRAVEECSLLLSATKKRDVDCGKQNSGDIKKMLKKKLKQYCKHASPWFSDGGCKYPSGKRLQGCSSVKCPARCALLPGCAWSRSQGPPYLTPAEVEARSERYQWYAGRCEIRDDSALRAG